MSDSTQIPDPAAFQEAADVQHAMFQAYLNSGFSEDQAIKIICGVLRNNMPSPVSMNGRTGD